MVYFPAHPSNSTKRPRTFPPTPYSTYMLVPIMVAMGASIIDSFASSPAEVAAGSHLAGQQRQYSEYHQAQSTQRIYSVP